MIDVKRIRQLLARAPRPPEEVLPEGASDGDCDAFEQRTGIRLPDDVRQWLQVTNGPCVGPGGLFGIRPRRAHLDIERYFGMFPSWQRQKWIPVAGDGCGNYYVIPTQGEYGRGNPVLFVDASSTYDTPSFIVASDIGHFLVGLLEKEIGMNGWPFDENYVTKTDAEITRFVGTPLPWTVD